MSDCLIVGGGVIGLSLAYELARHGLRVRVIDASTPAREASWAGAGILPPASADGADPLEQLTALSNRLHRDWHAELLAATGIDNGYRRSGAIYLARTAGDARQLERFVAEATARGISAERLSKDELAALEPRLRPAEGFEAAYVVDDECQIRNPRHLKALLAGCAGRGVQITPGAAAHGFDIRSGRIRAVHTNLGSIGADCVCITTGAWTAALCEHLGARAAIRPIRGQMLLLSTSAQLVSRIVNEGRRYLVPRGDGRLLAGSTEEDVGFDRTTTAGAIAELLGFAIGLVDDLRGARIERQWAGLRPATADGLPYLGAVPGLENAYVAAGHFRSGLQLSTGTAVAVGQCIRGQRPAVDLSPFGLNRPSGDPSDAPHARRLSGGVLSH